MCIRDRRSLGSYSVLRHQKSHHQDKDIKESVLAFDNVQDILPAPLSFTLKKGQILKIICSSNRETDYLLSILRRRASAGSGSILFRGQPLQSVSLNQYLKSCGIIESNPRRTVLFHNMTVLYNLCVPLDSKIHNFWTNPGNQKGVEYTLKDIIPPGYLQMNIDQVPMEIVQKVIYCRWLLYVPELLVCMNPFSIIDTSLNQITPVSYSHLKILEHRYSPEIICILPASYFVACINLQEKVFYHLNRMFPV